jgi:energy-coupling factor transporter ATP-binding protein EcfA2
MDLLYVIGEPGAGKSTLVKHLTRGLPYEDTTSPFAFRRYDCGVWELGARRPDFSGTDALGLSVQPVVERTLEGFKPKLVIAEGDRLANAKFFEAARGMGYTLHIVHLAGLGVAAMQRQIRGSNQNEAWVKGRRTKVYALAAQYGALELPAGTPLGALTAAINNPVAIALDEARETAVVPGRP